MSRLVHEAGSTAACLAMWSGEDEFKPLLEKALLKPSKSSLAAVTDIAVRDEKWVLDRAYTSWPPCVLTPSN